MPAMLLREGSGKSIAPKGAPTDLCGVAGAGHARDALARGARKEHRARGALLQMQSLQGQSRRFRNRRIAADIITAVNASSASTSAHSSHRPAPRSMMPRISRRKCVSGSASAIH